MNTFVFSITRAGVNKIVACHSSDLTSAFRRAVSALVDKPFPEGLKAQTAFMTEHNIQRVTTTRSGGFPITELWPRS